MNLLEKLCFVDLETTGLDPYNDRIISYSFLKFEVVKSKSFFGSSEEHALLLHDTFVNPEGRKNSAGAYAINKISNEDLITAPNFSQQIVHIDDFVKGCIIIAHNSSFDESFLREEYKRANKEFNFHFVDSIDLLKTALPELPKFSLDYVCNVAGIEKNGHSAVGDTVALYQLFIKLNLIKHLDLEQELENASRKIKKAS